MSNLPDHLNPTILQLERTIAGMERTIEGLRAHNDATVDDSELIRVTEERDEWKIIAAKLRRLAKQHSYACNDGVYSTCNCGLDEALADYDRLTRSAKAKGGGE